MAGLSYRGTSAGQDFRFANKEAKLLKQIGATAPKEYETKVISMLERNSSLFL
jgi:hypothetical protein